MSVKVFLLASNLLQVEIGSIPYCIQGSHVRRDPVGREFIKLVSFEFYFSLI